MSEGHYQFIDREPQTFVVNINMAEASDVRPATLTIFRSRLRPSHLVLPVLP